MVFIARSVYRWQRMKYAHLYWTEVSREKVVDGKIFTLERSKKTAPDGRSSEYMLVNAPDWVNVIAVVHDDAGHPCFLMVRQFRQGGEALTLEFPGGIVDPGEAPETAAVRELREETGYTAESVRCIGRTNPNPAFMTNTCHTFFANAARPATGQDLDPNEIVDVERIPVDDVLRGAVEEFDRHAIMLAALRFYVLATSSES